MSFLDKVKQQAGVVAGAAGDVAHSAVKQTKALAAIGRIKLAISSEEDKMKKAYTELGRLFYRDYESKAERDIDEYQPWCDKVADAKEQIARLNDEIVRVREAAAQEPEPEAATDPETAEADSELLEDIFEDADAAPADAETPQDPTPAEPAPAEAAEPPAETPTPETTDYKVFPEEPTVGTLYVDTSNTEE